VRPTPVHPHDLKPPRLLAAQRHCRAIDSKFERVTAQRAAQERELRTLDETEHHQPLDGSILGLDRFDSDTITWLEVGQSQGLGSAQ
jgi:hypothetical protein